MANIRFSRKVFEKEIGKLTEDMQHKIAMFATPVEEVTDDEIELEVFPNRPDLLSYQGFKRSFLAYLGKKTGRKEYKINKPKKNYKVIVDKSVADVRPFTACAIVRGVKLNDDKIKELIDVQEKLHNTVGRRRKKVAIGIYPMEKIKLPITFKAVEPDKIRFVPLESTREMSGLEILQRHPTGKEYAHLLEGKQKFPIFVDAEDNILSMPPIINSESTGRITEKTKDIFIECSGFDFEILKKCLNIIVTAMADMSGDVYQMELKGLKTSTPDLEPEKVKISIENVNKVLGLDLNEKQVKGFLERMGYNYSKGNVEVPAWRTDYLHEVDLIEDVAIAYGYENIVPEIPAISTIAEADFNEIVKQKIANILAGLNMLEVSSYHLSSLKNQFVKMGINEKDAKGFVEVEESKTEYNLLRKDLTNNLMRIFAENVDSEYPQRIYEIGRVFGLVNDEIVEGDNLAVAVAPGNFTELKQILEYLGRMLDVKFEVKESEKAPAHFIDGRVAEIFLGKDSVGFVGEVHPKILRNWKVKMPIALFEISLNKIFEVLKD